MQSVRDAVQGRQLQVVFLGPRQCVKPNVVSGDREKHEFQVVHIARAGRKAMERMAGLPRGDG